MSIENNKEREAAIFRRAFFVVGPESSGTRITSKILLENGCFGSDKHIQQTDGLRDPDILNPYDFVAIRRSIPHNKYYPDIEQIYDYLHSAGFENVHTIVTTRNWNYIARSQVKEGYAGAESEAILSIQLAYKQIFDSISMPYTISHYTDLVNDPLGHQNWLCQRIGLEFTKAIEIVDGDLKYK